MPTRVILRIRTPAMMPPAGPTAPVPDATPIYQSMISGNQAMMLSTHGVVPPAIGAATVTGGHRVGDKVLGCTYFAGPYVIPGLGDIEIEQI